MMPLRINQICATFLLFGLVVLPILPLVALADDVTTSATSTTSNPTATESSSAATTTAASTETSSSASSSAAVTSAASESAATTTDELIIHATTTGPSLIVGTSTVSEAVNDTATTTGSGLIPLDTASTTPLATSTPESATTTTSAEIDLAVASSTQTIVTGSSVALANILNLLNATFINSNGSILFANLTDSTGTVDVRDGNLFAGLCGTGTCAGVQGIQINLVNDAQILNQILINASSGENDIANASSSAAIGTGNAYAGLNLINLANLTVVDSSYLILTLNAFQDIHGDLVFPALQSLLNQNSGALSGSDVDINNTARVNNEVGASAQTGGNTLSAIASSSAIVTGTSDARLNIFNQINSLLMGNGISVLLRFGGPWNGAIEGLIPGVSVERTANSVFISGGGSGGALNPLSVGLSATTSASIDNQSSVNALTGNNAISNGSSTALIRTGNAYAGANIINVANQTVIGRNWLLAIVNIFGNFTGAISFGRPDLWVGDSVSVPVDIRNGTSLGYSIRVTNKGDAPAHDVRLTEVFDAAHLGIASASMPYTLSDTGALVFALDTILPHESRDITYEAVVQNTDEGTAIVTTSTAHARETDNNLSDNTDRTSVSASIIAASVARGGGGGGTGFVNSSSQTVPIVAKPLVVAPAEQATLAVVRTSARLASVQGGSVTEILQVMNTSSVVAQDIVLDDVLQDPSGFAVHTEHFDIGELLPGDGVEITYVFNFAADAPVGEYILRSVSGGGSVTMNSEQNGVIALSAVPVDETETVVATTTAGALMKATTKRSGVASIVGPRASDTQERDVQESDAVEVPVRLEALVASADTADGGFLDAILGLIAIVMGAFGRVFYRIV